MKAAKGGRVYWQTAAAAEHLSTVSTPGFGKDKQVTIRRNLSELSVFSGGN
jgi:hypothetical protein